MAALKTISYASLAALLSGLLILGGISLVNNDKAYYCEARAIAMECNSLSAYYGMDNGKCNNKDLGNKLCSSGWLKVTYNQLYPEQNTNPLTAQLAWCCNHAGCKQGVCN